MKIVSDSRWSLNAGSIRLNEERLLHQNSGLLIEVVSNTGLTVIAQNWACGVFIMVLTHSHIVTSFDAPWKQGFWKHCGKTHYQTTNFRLFKTERFCRWWFQIWQKWQKVEKLLVTSNFSFSHSVFKRPVSQGHQKVSLCGNGLSILTYYQSTKFQTGQNWNSLQMTILNLM